MDLVVFFQSLIFIKTILLIILVGYAVFAVVIFSQIKTLNRIITQADAPLLEKLALIQIVLALSLFLTAFVIL